MRGHPPQRPPRGQQRSWGWRRPQAAAHQRCPRAAVHQRCPQAAAHQQRPQAAAHQQRPQAAAHQRCPQAVAPRRKQTQWGAGRPGAPGPPGAHPPRRTAPRPPLGRQLLQPRLRPLARQRTSCADCPGQTARRRPTQTGSRWCWGRQRARGDRAQRRVRGAPPHHHPRGWRGRARRVEGRGGRGPWQGPQGRHWPQGAPGRHEALGCQRGAQQGAQGAGKWAAAGRRHR
jgi:hypothetical protein